MELQAPVSSVISCGIFADSAMLRVLLHGDWHADSRDGSFLFSEEALYFGPQSKRMPVSVRGGFASVGMALRPGSNRVLGGPSTPDVVDRIIPYEGLGWNQQALMARFDPTASVEEWMVELENCMELLVRQSGGTEPDATTAGFHHLALSDPNITVSDASDLLGVDKRKLERVVKRDFGLTPKQVLRRARALDMAAHLRGVADIEEAQELVLRYFDQSHLSRDFTTMFGMTPLQFVRTPQPLLTITLESRQARRLEELERIGPGDRRPWQ
ncbi:helix-turn-helix domain-containing protein [Parerythrobacter aestuarii]|uniref:helix-turn-helix domain-containing protein n=1 Tax=Parerythrobacter aestuarii TaxID=3020909 RepID=UPI0024DEAD04|nr:helix-turn-helix domain-containing protein [Parerythrobacter aestuarii]